MIVLGFCFLVWDDYEFIIFLYLFDQKYVVLYLIGYVSFGGQKMIRDWNSFVIKVFVDLMSVFIYFFQFFLLVLRKVECIFFKFCVFNILWFQVIKNW